MQFVCLGYFNEEQFNAMPEPERQSFLAQCLAYDEELKQRGHYAGGFALGATCQAATVRPKSVTDGPYIETKEQLGGILILEARDLNEAIALLTRHPGIKAGGFEIRATVNISQDGHAVVVSPQT